jgi:hypothetical protein
MLSMQRGFIALACALGLMSVACGDDTKAPSSNDGEDAATDDAAIGAPDANTADANAADADTAAEALRSAVGTFGIELVAAVPATDETTAAAAYTDVSGRVYDAMLRSPWRLLLEDGDCKLFEPHNPFCDPACTNGATCGDGNVCVPARTPLNVGAVALRGLRDEAGPTELSLNATAPANFYQVRGASALAYPPFEEGDTVTLSAQGGELAAFELSARAIAPIEVLTDAPIPFGDEAPTLVRWTPAGSGATSRIIVRVDISHHGGNKGEVVCDTDDDGEIELPTSVVDGLIALGVAGHPSLEIERFSTSEVLPAAPGISLRLVSSDTRAIEIPGIVSCTDEDAAEVCAEGETCLVTRLCG